MVLDEKRSTLLNHGVMPFGL